MEYLALSDQKVSGREQGFGKNMASGSPLASSFPSVRRRCHPSLGPRQGYNSMIWVLATDTITWTADKPHLPGPRRTESLLSHNSLGFGLLPFFKTDRADTLELIYFPNVTICCCCWLIASTAGQIDNHTSVPHHTSIICYSNTYKQPAPL